MRFLALAAISLLALPARAEHWDLVRHRKAAGFEDSVDGRVKQRIAWEDWEGWTWEKREFRSEEAGRLELKEGRLVAVEWGAVSLRRKGSIIECAVGGELRASSCDKSADLALDGCIVSEAALAAGDPGEVALVSPVNGNVLSGRRGKPVAAALKEAGKRLVVTRVRLDFDGFAIDLWLDHGAPVFLRDSRIGLEAAARPGLRPDESPDGVSEEDVTFPSGDITMAGTLARPHGPGPFPAFVLLAGSGANDRDCRSLGHEFLDRIAWDLAQAGVASLRYDDRGVGGSGGDFSKIRLESLVDDARAAVVFLRKRQEISKVALLGHSEGALVAPVAAAAEPGVCALFLLGAPARPLDAVLLEQIPQIYANMGAMAFEMARAEAKRFETILKAPSDDLDLDGRRVHAGWLRSFSRHDPEAAIARVTCPVDLFQGLADAQVAPYHADRLEAALKSAGRTVAAHRFEGLDHFGGRAGQDMDEGFRRAIVAAAVARLVK